MAIPAGCLAAALCAPAGAADTRAPAAVPLKGEIKLKPGSVRATTVRPVPVKFDQINKQFGALAGNAQTYEAGVGLMPTIHQTCSTKAYSVQDQKAAGCSGNESLDQCTAKLYKHCVATWSGGFSIGTGGSPVPGGSGGVSVSYSTKKFKDAAQASVAQARALSQMLSQYALQAEQNAKSFAP
jgi:hypothetical protein